MVDFKNTLIKNGDQGQMVQTIRKVIQQWQNDAGDIPGKIWIYEENDDTPYAEISDFNNHDHLFEGLVPTNTFFDQLEQQLQTNLNTPNPMLTIVIIDDFESRTWDSQKQHILHTLFTQGPTYKTFTIFANSAFADLTANYHPYFEQIIDLEKEELPYG
ncbi:hypothetical protein [Weissella minor]|uniref:Uncharacterized protein n=1 Tax=Weissella minor TaxID=1620 RepID=A0A0R2JQ60_9LACO|nr:hypothetical protein [Weissella minor]KRN76631.1 hypothetical protein IV67_GL000133 [Weissella minor]